MLPMKEVMKRFIGRGRGYLLTTRDDASGDEIEYFRDGILKIDYCFVLSLDLMFYYYLTL